MAARSVSAAAPTLHPRSRHEPRAMIPLRVRICILKPFNKRHGDSATPVEPEPAPPARIRPCPSQQPAPLLPPEHARRRSRAARACLERPLTPLQRVTANIRQTPRDSTTLRSRRETGGSTSAIQRRQRPAAAFDTVPASRHSALDAQSSCVGAGPQETTCSPRGRCRPASGESRAAQPVEHAAAPPDWSHPLRPQRHGRVGRLVVERQPRRPGYSHDRRPERRRGWGRGGRFGRPARRADDRRPASRNCGWPTGPARPGTRLRCRPAPSQGHRRQRHGRREPAGDRSGRSDRAARPARWRLAAPAAPPAAGIEQQRSGRRAQAVLAQPRRTTSATSSSPSARGARQILQRLDPADSATRPRTGVASASSKPGSTSAFFEREPARASRQAEGVDRRNRAMSAKGAATSSVRASAPGREPRDQPWPRLGAAAARESGRPSPPPPSRREGDRQDDPLRPLSARSRLISPTSTCPAGARWRLR